MRILRWTSAMPSGALLLLLLLKDCAVHGMGIATNPEQRTNRNSSRLISRSLELGAPPREEQQQQLHRQRRALEGARNSIREAVDAGGNDDDAAFPLRRCEADCDSHADCREGLRCWQRRANEPVPGCDVSNGADLEGYDICYDPRDPPTSHQVEFIGDNGMPASFFPLPKCKGDCDSADDCAQGLECYHLDADDGYSRVPGCDGLSLRDGSDYCYDPNDDYLDIPEPELDGVGSNWEDPDDYPLKLCEGDCDGDFDCEGDFICHHRKDEDSRVPSCRGSATGNFDACIRPQDSIAKPPIYGAFRLKLFWEDGFDWQELPWEKNWCMSADSGKNRNGDEIVIRECDDENTWFVLHNLDGDETQLKVAGTDLCMEILEEKRDYGRHALELRECSSSEERQVFYGEWGGEKFEIETYYGGCLSQDHHPKGDEKIYDESCDRAYYYDTLYWVEY